MRTRSPQPAHAALDHVADAEFLGDLLQVDGLALVDERGIARDHEEPAQLGQRGDDVFADAVGKILLRRIAAHVVERQHGNGRPLGKRRGRGARARGFRPTAAARSPALTGRSPTGCCTSPTKRKPLARDGADQLLALAAVADRLARGIDAAGQGRIRHDPAAPDRRDEIVLRDDAIAVLHKVDQQIEHLRLDGNGFGAAAQLAPVGVKHVIGKEKLHVAAPTGLPSHLRSKSTSTSAKPGRLHVSRLRRVVAHGPVADARLTRTQKKFRTSPEKLNAVRSAASSRSCGPG